MKTIPVAEKFYRNYQFNSIKLSDHFL